MALCSKMNTASRIIVRYHSTRPNRDFLTNIRVQVAKALTESLSPEIRQDILGTTTDTSPAPSSPPPPVQSGPTIAEAVAAARREEAEKHEKRWNEQRESIISEAEAAARARIEHDITLRKRQLAFQKWQKDLEHENEQREPVSSESEVSHPTSSLPEEQEDHPILGKLIVDLGYKRIYRASTSSLANIPVWEKQRVYRHDRAKLMVSDKMKSLDLGLPGVITIHEDAETGKLAILDGQHRIGMLSLLTKKDDAAHFIDSVLVEVFSSKRPSFPKELFVEINKAEPVKLVDMPGIAKSADRNLLSSAATTLREKFPDMFKPSQRCRVPHLNEDNLRDALFAAKILDRHHIKTAAELYEWMMEQNNVLAERYQSDEEAQAKLPKTALQKALKHNFYLGLDSSWYYN